MSDKVLRVVVWDNPHINNERIMRLIPSTEVERFIEALVGQGCPCGYWSLEGWQRVKDSVMSGKYKLSL